MPEIPTSWLIGEPDEPEISDPMLDAATAAILRAQEFGTGEDEPEYTRENFKRLSLYPAWQQAERYAKAALEAAGVAEMAARIAELEAMLQLGWELSTWTACINWRGGENQKEWLDDLRQKIEEFQEKAKLLDAPSGAGGK